MKSFLFATLLFLSTPVQSQGLKYRNTTCNVYYNNWGKVYSSLPCKSWFSGSRLQRVNIYLPNARRTYNWSTSQSNVSQDPRWAECIRHTGSQGNQYQVCTEKSPQQLGV